MKFCSKKESIELLKILIGDLDDDLQFLAPMGWSSSAYFPFFHPTAEQQYQANIALHKRFYEFLGDTPLPQIEEFEDDNSPTFIEAELLELLGRVLYELLNNFQLQHNSGSIYDFGSGRSCADFIAQFFNMHYPQDHTNFTDLDFFLALNMDDYINSFQVYVLFFQRLRFNRVKLIFKKNEQDILNDHTPNEIAAYKLVFGKLPFERRK